LVIKNILFAVGFLLFISMVARTQTPPKYEPNETETLQLQLAQAHAQLAQQQFNYAQQNLSKAADEFSQTATKIIKAHKWPEDLRIDPNTLAFTEAPKPAPAPPPVPEPSPKK